jgi:rubrerythrin
MFSLALLTLLVEAAGADTAVNEHETVPDCVFCGELLEEFPPCACPECGMPN